MDLSFKTLIICVETTNFRNKRLILQWFIMPTAIIFFYNLKKNIPTLYVILNMKHWEKNINVSTRLQSLMMRVLELQDSYWYKMIKGPWNVNLEIVWDGLWMI